MFAYLYHWNSTWYFMWILCQQAIHIIIKSYMLKKKIQQNVCRNL